VTHTVTNDINHAVGNTFEYQLWNVFCIVNILLPWYTCIVFASTIPLHTCNKINA